MDIINRNNVKVFGQGTQAMVFAHGFGCGQQMWRYIWPAFEDRYRIVLFDYVGSGKSDMKAYNAERYASLNGYALDLIEVLEALNLEKTIFVGHSVSGMIGLLASLKQPHLFESLIMIGPSPRYINDQGYTGGFEEEDIQELLSTMDNNYIGWSNYIAPNIMGNPDRPELGEELTESFCSTDPVVARQFAEVTFLSDNRADLVKTRHPTLVLQCSQDLIAPSEVGQYLESNVPNCTQKVMKATGHCPHLSAPEETIGLMKDFLS
ncbi:alpha/beta fold hydrolase [Dyadobacter tibetensis]|uniref:alpha/beta fold hydrolase n=1 Tax=Dyadobacter tibetensis TaxID=1211851 RepID=UPI00046E7FB7|nr:alpha/beta hydrolase [Dyadobacter tibetensis]